MMADRITWHGHVGSIDASDLGFAPGKWPATVEVTGKKETLTFLRLGDLSHHENGKLAAVSYLASSGDRFFTLVVHND